MHDLRFTFLCTVFVVVMLLLCAIRFHNESWREYLLVRIGLSILLLYTLAAYAGEVFYPVVIDIGLGRWGVPRVVTYVSLAVATVFACASAFWSSKKGRKRDGVIAMWLLTFILTFASFGGFLGLLNGVFDKSKPQTHKVHVKDKRFGRRCWLYVTNWHAGRPDVLVKVDGYTYDECEVGDIVSIRTGQGFFGLERYYETDLSRRVVIESSRR